MVQILERQLRANHDLRTFVQIIQMSAIFLSVNEISQNPCASLTSEGGKDRSIKKHKQQTSTMCSAYTT